MSKQTEKDPSNQDILKAIKGFANDVEKRFGEVEERFSDVDKRFDRFATTVVLKTDLEKYATKADLSSFRNDVATKLDRILVNTEKLDIERISHLAWLQRHEVSINAIKTHLQLT